MNIRYLWPTLLGANLNMYKRRQVIHMLFRIMLKFLLLSLSSLVVMYTISKFANLNVTDTKLSVFAGLVTITTIVFDSRLFYNVIKNFLGGEIDYFWGRILRPSNKAEKWAIALAWWIPRKYRGPIVGDILEDCNEMREMCCGEWRIRIQVIWQWAIAIATLIPTAVFGSIWRIFSPTK